MRRSENSSRHRAGDRLAILVDAAGAVALFLLLFAALHLPMAV